MATASVTVVSAASSVLPRGPRDSRAGASSVGGSDSTTAAGSASATASCSVSDEQVTWGDVSAAYSAEELELMRELREAGESPDTLWLIHLFKAELDATLLPPSELDDREPGPAELGPLPHAPGSLQNDKGARTEPPQRRRRYEPLDGQVSLLG